MMRVLLVAGSYPPEQCGVGDYTEKLAIVLATLQNVTVGVLTTSSDAYTRTDTNSVELITVIHQWLFSGLFKLINAIRKWKPDVMHFQYPSQGYTSPGLPSFLPLVCRVLGIKVVQTWHEPQYLNQAHRIKSLLYFFALKLGAKGLIFVRPNYENLLSPFYCQLIKNLPKVTIPNANPLPVSALDKVQKVVLRAQYLGIYQRLIVFFGFINPNKGIELLFDVATPASDSLVIAGGGKDDRYRQQLVNVAQAKGWRDDQLHFTGFLSPIDAADLLAVADAVVLPFIDGGGGWNTSVHCAMAQGTLVITTAVPARGDEPKSNLYTAAPLDVISMRTALNQLAGRRVTPTCTKDQWDEIARAHVTFYQKFVPAYVGKQEPMP